LLLLSVYPVIYASFLTNPVAFNQARLLQANNVLSNTSEDCEFLRFAVQAWFKSSTVVKSGGDFGRSVDVFVKWAQLKPKRCEWQRDDGIITECGTNETSPLSLKDVTTDHFSDLLDIRRGGIRETILEEKGPADFGDGQETQIFYVRVLVDDSPTIARA
jgi:hypothetical protein